MSEENRDAESGAIQSSVAPEDGVLITRTIDAPRALVFKAWTEPSRLMRWWAPKGWSTPSCRIDLRPGGVFHYCMRSPEGNDFWGRGVYRAIDVPQRIVYTDSFSNEDGRLVEPARYGMSYGYPSETQVTVTFTDREGMTEVTLHHAIPESVPERSGVRQGWTEMLGRLADDLASVRLQTDVTGSEVVLSRIIAAPRERVFKAWTDPAYLAQWWGPHGFTTPSCEVDARPGGHYRIVMRSEDGVEYPLRGEYREIVEPERLVMTSNWAEHPAEWLDLLEHDRRTAAGEPAREALDTVTFEEVDGGTMLIIRTTFDSAGTRDAMLKTGMADGWGQSLERLEALLS